MEPTEVIYMGTPKQECECCGAMVGNAIETTDGEIYCDACWEEFEAGLNNDFTLSLTGYSL